MTPATVAERRTEQTTDKTVIRPIRFEAADAELDEMRRRIYRGAFFNDYSISVPAAVSVFPEEVYQAPRSWTSSLH